MTKINSNGEEWLFIHVPDKAIDFTIAKNILGEKFCLKYRVPDSETKWTTSYKGLGDEIYTIYATSDIITEEEAAGIVENYDGLQYYSYYANRTKSDVYYCKYAKNSFVSLLKAYDMSEGRFLILKRIYEEHENN